MHPHVVAEHMLQVAQQMRLVAGAHHAQGLMVDVEYMDFLYAAVDEFRMHAQEGGEVGDALLGGMGNSLRSALKSSTQSEAGASSNIWRARLGAA